MANQVNPDVVFAAISNSAVSIIDVRTPGEFSKGSIKGSVNIPVDEIAEKIEASISDKDRLIYLYCLSGSRSQMAADILTDLGYTHAFSMTNGLLMWRFKKYELV
ncbi:MAG: rhodanese-like domain-containing protein [Microgenomates group bacterium]